MSEFTYERLRENLEWLKMKNTLEILDNYLEQALKDNVNVVEILDHIFAEEAKSKASRAIEKQIQMSGFPMKKGLNDFDFNFQPSIDKRQIDELCTMRFLENAENIVFLGPPGVGKTHLATAIGLEAARHRFSTYYINCHALIEQLKKAHYENHLPDKLRTLGRYKLLIIDEIGYLPMDIQGANLFFQLIARRYEKTSTIFTSNKTFSQTITLCVPTSVGVPVMFPSLESIRPNGRRPFEIDHVIGDVPVVARGWLSSAFTLYFVMPFIIFNLKLFENLWWLRGGLVTLILAIPTIIIVSKADKKALMPMSSMAVILGTGISIAGYYLGIM